MKPAAHERIINTTSQVTPMVATRINLLIEPSDVIAQVGSFVTLSAVVKTKRPNYQWYNQVGEAMPGMNRSNLLIGPMKESDYGFYRLSVLDEITYEKVLTRWVEIKNPKDLIPRLIKPARGGEFQKGDTIRLTAHFTNAKYHQWYQNGIKLEGCAGNTLIIEDAVLENTGDFTLVVANETCETCLSTVRVEIV